MGNDRNVKAECKKIIDILLSEESLFIPPYQRPYKWTSKNVNQLIDDIISNKNKSAYRIGALIIHREDGNGNVKLNIVDGQQRIITIFLIAMSIIDRFKTNTDMGRDLCKRINSQQLPGRKKIEEIDGITPTSIFEFNSPVSIKNISENAILIRRRVEEFTVNDVVFFLFKCEFSVMEIDNISEAFQLFDSQNARGKDLEPHDLLKAYHLRSMNMLSSENEKLEVVEAWESYPAESLSSLFELYLYRSRRWMNGHAAISFTKADIDEFKGISPVFKENYPFFMIYKIANYFIDEYNDSAAGQIKGKENFPFQLNQVIIDGRRFFEFVGCYLHKKDELEQAFLSPDSDNPTVKAIYSCINRTGDKYVFQLFEASLLAYYDKFGKERITDAIDKLFIWTYSLRVMFARVYIESVNNHALGLNSVNMFQIIKEAKNPEDVINVVLPASYPEKGSKIEEIKKRFLALMYNVGDDK